MKKLITVVLILALLMTSAALADVPDISGLTKEELVELNQQIGLKLFSEKLINGVHIPIGVYTVGEDIPAGSYRVKLENNQDNSVISLNYIDDEGKKRVSGSFALGDIYGAYEVGKMTLENGQIVIIDFAPVVFFPYSGLLF